MPQAAAHRRAVPVLAPWGTGAVLVAVVVCLLHVLCGAGAAGPAQWQAPERPVAVAAGDPSPDSGSHHHPDSPARRAGGHMGPQHRAVPPCGQASAAWAPLPEAPAGSSRGPGREAWPPAGSALPHTVLRC
ncbi:hypothetical protein [Actinacidiphila soli]|uniref:hypothetical protein n=1 Tax=Actinacidiphila soli TaxID=2487275 RepID=UPI000FCAFE1A|nr:hypothetical protein [Actinacidiphila soli]